MGETKEVMPVNKKAKGRLFTKIYESEENLRSLARFLIGEDIGDIEIRNVDPVVFGNKENDLAFICNESIYIYNDGRAVISLCQYSIQNT